MSYFSDAFRRSARFVVTATAFVAAVGGGVLGMEWAHDARQPALSTKTFHQEVQGQADGAERQKALAEYQRRIEQLAALKKSAAIGQSEADGFLQDLRMARHLSEKDYADIIGQYESRVGVAPSGALGNIASGIGYNHECHMQTEMFSLMGMDFLDAAEKSEEIGQCMAENRNAYGAPEALGGAGGAALGAGLILIPALRRRRP